jgi:hypothetical protein
VPARPRFALDHQQLDLIAIEMLLSRSHCRVIKQ